MPQDSQKKKGKEKVVIFLKKNSYETVKDMVNGGFG